MWLLISCYSAHFIFRLLVLSALKLGSFPFWESDRWVLSWVSFSHPRAKVDWCGVKSATKDDPFQASCRTYSLRVTWFDNWKIEVTGSCMAFGAWETLWAWCFDLLLVAHLLLSWCGQWLCLRPLCSHQNSVYCFIYIFPLWFLGVGVFLHDNCPVDHSPHCSWRPGGRRRSIISFITSPSTLYFPKMFQHILFHSPSEASWPLLSPSQYWMCKGQCKPFPHSSDYVNSNLLMEPGWFYFL